MAGLITFIEPLAKALKKHRYLLANLWVTTILLGFIATRVIGSRTFQMKVMPKLQALLFALLG